MFLKKNFFKNIDEKEYVKTNKFLQLEGSKNIFVAGDIVSVKENKTAQNAENHAHIEIENLRCLINKKPLEKYETIHKQRPIVISLGKWNGIFTSENLTFSGIIPGILKNFIEKRFMMKYKNHLRWIIIK